MDGSVLTAILGCAGTIVGSAIGAIATAGKTNFRLEQLEKRWINTIIWSSEW